MAFSCKNICVRFRRLVPIALVMGLAVGCTSDGGDGPSDSRSSVTVSSSLSVTSPAPVSTTPTPESSVPTVPTTGPNVRPGEKPPTLTPNARQNTRIGGGEFSRYWMKTLDWAYATTNSALPRQHFAASCGGCSNFLDNIIDKTAARNRHFDGGRLTPYGLTIRSNDHHAGADLVVDVTVNQSALKVRTGSGKIVETAKAVTRAVFRVWVAWRNSAWVVVDWKHAVT